MEKPSRKNLKDSAIRSTERQAVNHLDRMTPKEIDVTRCVTLKDAWDKLTGAYGSPTYIARLLLKDFYNLKLTKANNETNVIQLKNILDKLESDLTTNECPDRCNDVTVIDHAESLVPERF